MRRCFLRKLLLCLLLLCPLALVSQAAPPGMGTINGTILNAAGEPVRDAIVTVSPGSLKVKTTAAGKFAAEVTAGEHRLLVSSARSGSATAEVMVEAGGSTSIDLSLSPTFHDEVVVSAGPEARAMSEVAQPVVVL